MKLQIKDSGAWRTLISFHAHDLHEVMGYAARLIAVQTSRADLQIVDADRKVIAYLPNGANCQWE